MKKRAKPKNGKNFKRQKIGMANEKSAKQIWAITK